MLLITGGAGYIGSHTCVELLQSGHDILILDNFSNSSRDTINRINELCGVEVQYIDGDILNKRLLQQIFSEHDIQAVLHFAGLKSVGDSVAQPLKYYDTNVSGSALLLGVMEEYGCKRFIFSSSATVYGAASHVPITEDSALNPENPYGRSKMIVESMLRDLYHSDPEWSIGILRYFNPVGAHHSGRLGENPAGSPNNLMPYVSQVCVGQRPKLMVFGDDYDTPDGTGIRDYIHVVDLAKGHVKALALVAAQNTKITVNLGTGRGYSVLEVIDAFERVSGHDILFEVVDRRSGDVAVCYASPEKAQRLLDWRAEYNLEQMCQDEWTWRQNLHSSDTPRDE